MSTAATILPVTINPYLATVQGGPFDRDTVGNMTSLYGPRAPIQDPDTGVWTGTFHYGLDLAVWPYLDLVGGVHNLRALFAGTIKWNFSDPLYGNAVWIENDDGTIVEYFHLYAPCVYPVGTRVPAGTIIGKVGNTGLSTGPHVHIGIMMQGGGYIDPLPYLWGARDVGELILGTNYYDEWGFYHDEYANYSCP